MAQIYPFPTEKKSIPCVMSDHKKDLYELIEINRQLQNSSYRYAEEELRYTDMTETEWNWLKESFQNNK